MKKTQIKKLLSLSVCIVLIAAMALFASGCNDNITSSDTVSSGVTQSSVTKATDVGEGDTEIAFTVGQSDGKETKFNVSTNEKTVGAALLAVKLIEGEDGPYGLYVKTVNGETHDYDAGGTYWSFYVNGEYAASGVDSTEIESGAEYMFKAEK